MAYGHRTIARIRFLHHQGSHRLGRQYCCVPKPRNAFLASRYDNASIIPRYRGVADTKQGKPIDIRPTLSDGNRPHLYDNRSPRSPSCPDICFGSGSCTIKPSTSGSLFNSSTLRSNSSSVTSSSKRIKVDLKPIS